MARALGASNDHRDPVVEETVGARQAGEDRFRMLIHHTPTPLWYVDARDAGEVFERLRAEGVTDIAAHLDAHPELVEIAKDIVLVTEINRAAVALFGAGAATDLIRPVRYLFAATPDMAKRVMVAHFEGRRNYVEQARMATFDGRVRDVVFSVTYPAPPEHLDTTFITMEDITERLRTEAQLRRLQADFAHAARVSMLGELATSIAHEVRQPLAAIVTNAETGLRWLAREEPNLAKARELIGRIAASALRANDIIQRVRSMAAKQEPERLALDLAEVVDEALHFVRHDLDAQGITLLRVDAGELPPVVGDRVQLQQVVVNLLVNGIQAIAQANARERRIELKIDVDGTDAVTLSVHDTGPGVAEADLGCVFDGFFTTKDTGMGIGLSICQSIIAEHGGEIGVTNHPAGGAMFRVSLPVGDDARPGG
ncbi:sensor histidine kinase [Caulobacter sp. UNC279MFTsu5.1]|uniref:sensor histidine kinase n=1 Tax=Caulobacter sp. UNC279MFTsu5.1 TaxID=1502775 RepID=UPI00035DDE90|nr:ATP-binding protein [Caulobacter sp. UNC279MFTsu5.1]SFJ86376.1 His Kinase A (phospho-acceptor) domain-containing protein [Caulobacter sp. UNC279MFTsu5.1]